MRILALRSEIIVIFIGHKSKITPKLLQIQVHVLWCYCWKGFLPTYNNALHNDNMPTIARWQPMHQLPNHKVISWFYYHYTILVPWFTKCAIHTHTTMHIHRKSKILVHFFQCFKIIHHGLDALPFELLWNIT
jgi:hypothetical protein